MSGLNTRPIPIPDKFRTKQWGDKANNQTPLPDPTTKVNPNPHKNHMQNAETKPHEQVFGKPTSRANGFSNLQSNPDTAATSPPRASGRRVVNNGGGASHSRDELFNGGGQSFLKQKTPCRARWEEPADPPAYPIKATRSGGTTAARFA